MPSEPARFDNPGYSPTKWQFDTMVRVVWANGRPGLHAYTVSGLRWTLTGSDWDIATFWKAD